MAAADKMNSGVILGIALVLLIHVCLSVVIPELVSLSEPPLPPEYTEEEKRQMLERYMEARFRND